MYLYTFYHQPTPEAPDASGTSAFKDDLDAVDTMRDFADVRGTPVHVVLQSGHRVTVEPKPRI